MTKDEALALIKAHVPSVRTNTKTFRVGSFGKKAAIEGVPMLFLTRPPAYKLALPGAYPPAIHGDTVRAALALKAGDDLKSLNMREYARETLFAALAQHRDDVIVLLGETLLAVASAVKS